MPTPSLPDENKLGAAHTSGPWQAKSDYTLEDRLTIIANVDGEYFTDSAAPHMSYSTIARCEDEYGERLPEAEANARLISAAPNLYAAAAHLVGAFDQLRAATTAERIITGQSEDGIRKSSNEALADLRAALAKAKGGRG